jgi:hypothetical protein
MSKEVTHLVRSVLSEQELFDQALVAVYAPPATGKTVAGRLLRDRSIISIDTDDFQWYDEKEDEFRKHDEIPVWDMIYRRLLSTGRHLPYLIIFTQRPPVMEFLSARGAHTIAFRVPDDVWEKQIRKRSDVSPERYDTWRGWRAEAESVTNHLYDVTITGTDQLLDYVENFGDIRGVPMDEWFRSGLVARGISPDVIIPNVVSNLEFPKRTSIDTLDIYWVSSGMLKNMLTYDIHADGSITRIINSYPDYQELWRAKTAYGFSQEKIAQLLDMNEIRVGCALFGMGWIPHYVSKLTYPFLRPTAAEGRRFRLRQTRYEIAEVSKNLRYVKFNIDGRLVVGSISGHMTSILPAAAAGWGCIAAYLDQIEENVRLYTLWKNRSKLGKDKGYKYYVAMRDARRLSEYKPITELWHNVYDYNAALDAAVRSTQWGYFYDGLLAQAIESRLKVILVKYPAFTDSIVPPVSVEWEPFDVNTHGIL